MSASPSTSRLANAGRFERNGIPADAQSAARIREEFAGWLQEFFDLDAVRRSDLILALNEALANAAEFAYLAAGRPGTMDIQARHQDSLLTVVVADHGLWRIPDPSTTRATRGRGIPLMRALSDRASIDHSADGTTVRLEWDDIVRR